MSAPQAPHDLGLVLSQASGRPLYMQIQEQVQHRVAVGDFAPGTKLPSIRELAVTLGISVITVKRAYLELEREGVIVTQQGKGSWVGEGGAGARAQQEELERHLGRAAEIAAAMGLSRKALVALLTRAAEERR